MLIRISSIIVAFPAFALVVGLIAEPVTAQGGKIIVGKNVHISGDRPDLEHGESVICASLTNPNHLVAAGASTTGGKEFQGHGEITGEIVYASSDGGKTWKFAFDTFKQGFSPDAACAYTPDGAAHFSTMAGPISAGENYFDNNLKLLNYRSSDGGTTWDAPVTLPGVQGADRQYMTSDNTNGKHHGALYIGYDWAFHLRSVENNLLMGSTQIYGLSRSPDGGKRWDLPATRITEHPFHNGNLDVLSDGTVLSILGLGGSSDPKAYDRAAAKNEAYPAASVSVIFSQPGGEFVGYAKRVADAYDMTEGGPPGVHHIFALAVDHSNAYKDRIYVVWNDARSGRYQPLISYSADKGETWSVPRSVSDDVLFDNSDARKGPHGTSPWIAVNKEGVVGVVWLDRRESRNSTKYTMRFSASLDGGETWLPSAKVSEQPMAARMVWEMAPYHFIYTGKSDTITAKLGAPAWDFTGGDVTAVTADAAGNFFPIWVDARTGRRQMYTAKITVQGTVAPQRVLVTTANDVTKSVALEFVPGTQVYDSASHTLRVDVRLRNTGKTSLSAPLVARLTSVSSGIAKRTSVANSDNGRTTTGAEWNFSSLLTNGMLNPGEATGAKRLTFNLEGEQNLSASALAGGVYGHGYLTLSIVVLSGAAR